jgi:hypothetical protein
MGYSRIPLGIFILKNLESSLGKRRDKYSSEEIGSQQLS